MCALADHLAVVEHHDAVGIHDGADALRDDQFGGILRFLGERVAYGTIGFEIKCGEGIVENQDFRMTIDGTCNRQALFLPARHVRSTLRNRGIVLLFLGCDEFGRLRDFTCVAHVGALFRGECAMFVLRCDQLFFALSAGRGRSIGHVDDAGIVGVERIVAVADVGCDRSFEQEGLLRHISNFVSQCLERVVAHVHAVDEHFTLRRIIETRHEVDERGFAGAGGTDERHGFALLGGEVDVFEHGFARIRVGEAHVAEFDFALFARFAGVAAGAIGDQRFGVEHFEHALCGHVRSRPQHEHHAHQQEAHDHLHGVAGEHHHVGEGGELVGRVGGVDQVGADPVHGKHKTVHDGVHQRHHEGHGTVGE